jgi:hypothetical protein
VVSVVSEFFDVAMTSMIVCDDGNSFCVAGGREAFVSACMLTESV